MTIFTDPWFPPISPKSKVTPLIYSLCSKISHDITVSSLYHFSHFSLISSFIAPSPIYTAAFNPNSYLNSGIEGRLSHILAVGTECGTVILTNADRKGEEYLSVHDNAILDLTWLSSNITNDAPSHKIATASGDRKIAITDLNTNTKQCLNGHDATVKCVRGSPSNPHLLVSGGRDGLVIFWDLRMPKLISSVMDVNPMLMPSTKKRMSKYSLGSSTTLKCSICAVEYVPTNPHMIIGAIAPSQNLYVWDMRYISYGVPTIKHTMPSSSPISSLAIDKKGRFLYALSSQHKIHQYNLHDFESGPVRIFSSKEFECDFFTKISLDPEDCWLSSGSCTGNIYVWNVEEGLNEINDKSIDTVHCRVMEHGATHVNAAVWSPCGDILATVGDDGKGIYWAKK